MKNTILRCTIASFVVLIGGTTAKANLAGPYTVDGNTLHLWHMDSGGVPVPDEVVPGGTNLAVIANGATLTSSSYTGFGKALNTLDGGQGALAAANKDAYLAPQTNVVTTTYADPAAKTFTFEALIWIGWDPTKNIGTTANGGNNRGTLGQIMTCEGSLNVNRVFQLRIAPIGTDSPANTAVLLQLVNVNLGGSQKMSVQVPTTGPDAIASNSWYHVAVTYNGSPGTADNVTFYWTLMDPSRTSASVLGTATMNANLPVAPTVLSIGNLAGRAPIAGNFLGLIDEVRISSIVRGPAGMMFKGSDVVISTQPANQFAVIGDTATLSVGASGDNPLYYQWQLGGSNVTGATNSSLTLANITTNQAGSYQVIVSNLTSSATSSTAVVQVGARIGGLFNTGVDDSGAVLAGGPQDPHWILSVSPDSYFPGPAAYVLTTPPSGWLANGPNSEWITPGNSDTAALSGNYTYQTSFTLDTEDPAQAQISGNWVSGNQGTDIQINGTPLGISNASSSAGFTPFTITNGFVAGLNTLSFVVNRASGLGMTGNRVELRGVAAPLATPTGGQILAGPANATATAGKSAVFTVSAVGSAPLSYTWYFGNTPLPTQTNYTLRLTGLATSQSGSYTVVVSNSLGSATSAAAILTVNPAPALAWLGLNSGDWDTSTVNWLDTGSLANTNYTDGADVVFDSRGSGAPTVNLAQFVQPNSILVSNDTSFNYTFSSSSFNAISGDITLTKSGSGTLTMDAQNIYSGLTLIRSGTVQVGIGDTSGTLGSSAVSNNGALIFNRSDSNTVANFISGSGSLTLASGTVLLTGSNSYTGTTTVYPNAILRAHTATALGTSDGGTTVLDGGSLNIDAGVSIPGEALTLGGLGTGPAQPNNDAFHKGGSGSAVFGGPITLTTNTLIAVDGANVLTLTNAAAITSANQSLGVKCNGTGVCNINGTVSLGTGSLIMQGTGTLVLTTNNNSWTGGTVISGGSITAGDGSLPSDGSGTLGPIEVEGALTFVNSTNVTIDGTKLTGGSGGRITLNGSGTVLLTNTSTFSGTNRILNASALRLAPGVNLASAQLTIGNAQVDTSRLELTGNNLVTGPIDMINPRAFTQRNNAPIIVNVSGTNTVTATGGIVIPAGGNLLCFESDSGYLIYNGSINSGSSARDFVLQGAGSGEIDGPITNGPSAGGNSIILYKLGTGTWKLFGANNYSTTVVSNGTLLVAGVTGSTNGGFTVTSGGTLGGNSNSVDLVGPVTIGAGGTLSPTLAANASAPVGTLGISGTLTLQAGSTVKMQLNKTAAANDEIFFISTMTYGGNLWLTNQSGTLAAGDAFKLFSASAYTGAFASITPATPGPNLAWDVSTMTTDGILRVAAAASSPKFFTPVFGNGQIVLSGSGGPPGGSFVVVTATNIPTPLTNWIRLSTNVFDSGGNFSVTNAVQLSDLARFFMLLSQ